jgi:hypothetical protein
MPQPLRSASVMAVLVGAAGWVLVVGCSALVSVDGLTGPAASADADAAPAEDGSPLDGTPTDATATDSTTTDGAADADTHVAPNLLDESSFENGCTWNGFQGSSATDTATARTGTKSCRICTSPTTADYFTGNSNFTDVGPVVGATYHAVGWVRSAPGAAAPPGGVRLTFRTLDPVPFTPIEGSATPFISFTAAWQKLEVSFTVTKPAANMDVYIATDTAPGACFLIDDVWLEKLP